MNEQYTKLRKEHFASNWLTWAALRHFTSASLLRELSYVIVDRISNGTISLGQILEEAEPAGQGSFASWIIRPISQDSPLANYLQRRIQYFCWQSDSGVYVEDSIPPKDSNGPSSLEKFIALGAADFSLSSQQISTIETEFQVGGARFIKAFCFAQSSRDSLNADDYCSQLKTLLSSIEMPLASVILKHFGDLCADVDDWNKAQTLYNESGNMLVGFNAPQWLEFKSAFQTLITQSQAAALCNIDGAASAFQHFERAFHNVRVSENPLLLANASWDAENVALSSSSENFQLEGIHRATILSPPLLHESHDDYGALLSWLNGHFSDAHSRFWSVLRRQIALGSATESRLTKAHYAESIIDELSLKIARYEQPDLFQMALRLLIESGLSKSAEKIEWNERVIDAYVNQECVSLAIKHASHHMGSLRERSLVVMTIFRKWLELISPDHSDVSTDMLRYLADLAQNNNSSFFESFNVSGRSLEALKEVADKRPELRRFVESEVSVAISTKIRSTEFWGGTAAGLEAAIAFVDVMSDSSLEKVITSTIEMMREIGSENLMWPLMRSALQLLIAEPVMLFSRRKPGLEREIVLTILEFGLHQESEQATTLMCLKDFDSEIVRKATVQTELHEAIMRIKQNAHQINSSNSIYNINALLYASAASGREGVESALRSLEAILKSVEDAKRPSMNLAHAYSSLMLLADRQNEIAADISVDINEFRLRLKSLIPLICTIWSKAKNQPLIFSTFSIPAAERPDSTVVHNWAFASLLFAASIGQETVLNPLVTEAATEPTLANGIALARVTKSLAKNVNDIDSDFNGLRFENRDVFYAALGRRLSILQRYDTEHARDYCKVLIDQCVRLGPREIDAAVFLMGVRLNLTDQIGQLDVSDYKKRLRSVPDLRQNLEPILGLFCES